MALKIEPLTIERLGDVRRLFEMLVVEHLSDAPYPIYDTEEVDNFCLSTYRLLQSRNQYFASWVAIRGHKIVGFIMVDVQYRQVGKPNYVGSVQWLYVHPRHRQRGIARRLLATAVAWARERGLTHAEWSAAVGDSQWENRNVPLASTRYLLALDDVATLFAPPKIAKIG